MRVLRQKWLEKRIKIARTSPIKDSDKKSTQLVQHLVRTFQKIGSLAFAAPEAQLRVRMQTGVDRSYQPIGTARQMVAIAASKDRSAALAKIHARTLVIHGLTDALTPAERGKDIAANCGRALRAR